MRRFQIIVNVLATAMIVFAAITLHAHSRARRGAARAADPLVILDRQVGAVDFSGSSLPDAAAALGKAAGVHIALDRAGAEDAADTARRGGFSEISLGGGTLGENLRMMLLRYGMTYAVEPNGIRITTIARMPPVMRIYDVRDLRRKLAATIPREGPTPRTASPPVSPVQNSGMIGGYAAGPPRSLPTKRTPLMFDQEAMDQIRDLVMDSVTLEDWSENGGALGTMHADINGFLVVTQTPYSHRQIVELLAAIRHADTMEWREKSPRRPR